MLKPSALPHSTTLRSFSISGTTRSNQLSSFKSARWSQRGSVCTLPSNSSRILVGLLTSQLPVPIPQKDRQLGIGKSAADQIEMAVVIDIAASNGTRAGRGQAQRRFMRYALRPIEVHIRAGISQDGILRAVGDHEVGHSIVVQIGQNGLDRAPRGDAGAPLGVKTLGVSPIDQRIGVSQLLARCAIDEH